MDQNKKSKYWIDGIERPITTIINTYIPDIFRRCFTYDTAYFTIDIIISDSI